MYERAHVHVGTDAFWGARVREVMSQDERKQHRVHVRKIVRVS